METSNFELVRFGVEVFIALIATPVAVVLWHALKKHATNHELLAKEFGEFRLHVAEHYSKKEELNAALRKIDESFNKVFDQLERMFDKLDKKADKERT